MFSKKMDLFADKFCKETGFSGVIRITHKEKIIYDRFLGLDNKETGKPFTETSMFSLYSLSKPFCALAIMLLYDRGVVDIEAHPSKYVPEASKLNKSLKIYQLMNHTSGVPDCYLEEEFQNSHLPGSYEKMREHLSLISEYPQYFEPGTDAKYANINYNIMALIIENVSGMKYSEFMKKEIFTPLEMPHAVVDEENLEIPDRVQGYEIKDDKILPVFRNANWMFGAGDIVGTVDDVYRLKLAIEHKLLIKEESWKKVLTPSPFNSMGFGCTIKSYDGKVRITHNGGHTGFRTYHIYLPQDNLDLILLSNSGWGIGRNAFETEFYKNFYGFDITQGKITPMDTGYAK